MSNSSHLLGGSKLVTKFAWAWLLSKLFSHYLQMCLTVLGLAILARTLGTNYALKAVINLFVMIAFTDGMLLGLLPRFWLVFWVSCSATSAYSRVNSLKKILCWYLVIRITAGAVKTTNEEKRLLAKQSHAFNLRSKKFRVRIYSYWPRAYPQLLILAVGDIPWCKSSDSDGSSIMKYAMYVTDNWLPRSMPPLRWLIFLIWAGLPRHL